MVKFKFMLNRNDVGNLLKSEEMQKVLLDKADKVMSQIMTDGYKKEEVYQGKNRPNVAIVASTYQAKKDNLSNNTLVKAMKAARK